MSEELVEGWDLDESSSSSQSILDQNFAMVMQPINFLQQSYPLEPDMIFGWRPKLPLSPVPLSYRNNYVDWLVQQVNTTNSKLRLVYLGGRPSNSVKINQQYDYQWKSRSKYNLNVAVLRDKIETVGCSSNRRIVRPVVCNYQFNSSFEGGNLDAVVAVATDQFDCFIRSDSNTQGHCNWYHFSVEAQEPGRCRLNIYNITKHASLYSEGMRPYVNDGYGWKQAGDDVKFQEEPCRYGSGNRQHQLQFSYEFRLPKQKVEFAYCIPYSYSRLERLIDELKKKYPKNVECASLTDSLGGVSLPLLTISNGQPSQQKRLVLVTARIHPGQSSSSFMLEGLIRNLLERQPLLNLLQEFEFKIVPMLNPDGVIIGNFRTSYSGKDLNRQFFTADKLVYPEICALNELALQLKQQYKNRFEYYFDLHSHSTRTGLFCYGPEHQIWSGYYLRCRAFAKLLERSDEMFSYRSSIFTISEHKKTTGRAKMFSGLHIPYTYTFELSNGFYQTVGEKLVPLDEFDMLRAGRVILEGFYSFEKVHRASMTVLHTAAIGNSRRADLSRTTPLKKRSMVRPTSKANISTYNKTMRLGSDNRTKSSKKRTQTNGQSESKNLTIDGCTPEKCTQIVPANNALQQLLNQIKLEPQLPEIIDGGSDSQPQDEDLQVQELVKLHNQLQHRQLSYPDTPPPEKQQVKHKRLKRKQATRHPVTSNSIQTETLRRPIGTTRQLHRCQTARLQRRLLKKPSQEKYLLAQKNFVLNL